MQDLLAEASKIKTAQLKERPGRQAWEQSPDFLKYTAFQADAETAAARAGPLNLRMQHATELKEQGNAIYGEDVGEALSLYTKAIGVFMWFDRGRNKDNEDIPLVNTLGSKAVAGSSQEEVDKASELVSACFANAALCLLKQEKPQDAIYACSKALDFDPYNVKALYRRADAYQKLGTTADLELCVMDLQEAQSLEPGNHQVRTSLAKYQAELRSQLRKDRQTFSSMFKNGGLYEEDGSRRDTDAAAGPSSQQGDQQDKEPLQHKLREADKALRGITRNMAKVRANEANRAARAGLLDRQAIEEQRQPLGFLAVMRHVPWWGWVLILMHLSYRMSKIWNIGTRKGRDSMWEDDKEL